MNSSAVVGHIPGKDRSPWQGYDEAVSALATTLDLRPGRPPDKEELEVTPTEIEQSIRAAREARQALGSPTYLMEPVTALAKERLDPEDPKRLAGESTSGSSPVEPGGASGGPRGYEWGSAVHAALAAAARGMEGEPFRLFCRTLLVEYELPVDETGEPRNLEELNTGFGEWAYNLSPDGLTLYFSTDRPGGRGNDWELWVALRPALDQPFPGNNNVALADTIQAMPGGCHTRVDTSSSYR